MTFLEAVVATTLQHHVRRPWRNNSDGKHMYAKDGILMFAHDHLHVREIQRGPEVGDVTVVETGMQYVPYVADILATDWEIVEDMGF